MNPSAFFIRRPVATTLLTLAIMLAGMLGFVLLPVAPLPQVDYPTIFVSASLPGASAETMASSVAMPLERTLGRIAGVNEMTSTSALGSSRIVLQFDLSRDINGAARDVQAAINAARSLLPSSLTRLPTYRKANPSDAPIMILAMTSDTLTQGQMYDYASTVVAQKLLQLEGVGDVNVGGSSLPAVRVDLNPDALAHQGIALDTVRAALNNANANRPKGSLEYDGRHWQIQANDQATKAADYRNLVVRYSDGATVRLSDIARVTDSVENLRNAGSANGRPSVLLVITRAAGANIIETVDRIRSALPQLQASIPEAIDLTVQMDRSPTIRASLFEVERTLLIAVALVILVVFLFLGNARATLIPCVVVPVSLVGSCAAMYLCGFSLNNLSLMALIVATGFVVDDAIVVLENTSRHIEAGMPPMEAAMQGAKEVGFTVLSMSVSLVAVFIPLLLMGGLPGRLFREFAVTLSVAILISMVVSLTMTPMMCSRLLRSDEEHRRHNRFVRAVTRFSNRIIEAMTRLYSASLRVALRHSFLTLLILLVTVVLNVVLYVKIPKGFFPQQDVGRVSGYIRADQSISFQAMRQKLSDFVRIVREDPSVDSVTAFTGGSRTNSGSMFIALKPLDVRKESVNDIIARLRVKLANEPGAQLFLNPDQDIRVGGRQANAAYQFTLQADELAELRQWEPKIRLALSALPVLADVNTDQQDKGFETALTIDLDAAARLGLSTKTVSDTLYNAFGQRQVSTIYATLNQYHVVMGVNYEDTQSPETLKKLFVIGPNNARIPLSAFARWTPQNAPLSVSHQGQFVATTISFNLMPDVSLSQATDEINRALSSLGVPTSIHGSFQGSARAFQQAISSQPWLILAAIVTVYLVLGILYESYVHPLTILSTLPSAGVGALLALMAFKTDFSLIALVGVLLLIGIVKKNAIMMIDFALEAERNEGLNTRDAIFKACQLRFRPIMMTTMAAILGAIPLALGHGDGAEMRQPLGISIVGGLIMSQVLTLYTTPVIYLYLDRFRLWCKKHFRRTPSRVANA